MRIITKFMLACAVVGSASLTSCKDYSEEDGNELRVNLQDQKKAVSDLEQKIKDLAAQLNEAKCGCDGVSITKNADGTYTITDKNGAEVKVSNFNSDANGNYVTDANGNKIYIPAVITKDNKEYIVIGDKKYELHNPTHTVTIDGKKITITDANDPTKTWTFDTANSGAGASNCACTVSYDETTGKYTIKAGDKSIEIEPGNVANFVDNGETVTLKVGKDGAADQKTVTLKKVKSEVRTAKNEKGQDVIYIQKYTDAGVADGEEVAVVIPESVDIAPILKELYGEDGTAADPKEGSVIDRLNKGENIIKDIYGENGTAENPEEGSIAARLNDVEEQIEDILERLGKLEDARAKQVTGIIVQQVVNPMFGSYNSLATNVQTNMLVAYYGMATKNIEFPSNDDSSITPIFLKSNTPIMNGKAGQLYVTINPNTVDFTGMDNCLSLVNSQDEECAVKLGAVQKTDEVLHFGITGPTRAADNGFYTVSATIDPAGLANPNVHLNIDKSQVKTALKDLVSVRNASGAKIAIADFAKVAVDAIGAMSLDAQGVKCSWEDEFGEHAVVSNYNIGAVAVAPLGFNTVDGVFANGGKYWQAYANVKSLMADASKNIGKNLSDKINEQFMLGKLGDDIAAIGAKFNHIDDIKPISGKIIMKANVTVGPFTDIPVGPFTQDVKVKVPAQSVDIKGQKVTASVMIDVPVSYDIENDKFVTKQESREVTVEIPKSAVTVPGQEITVPVTIPVQYVTIPAQTVTINADVTESVNQIFNGMIGDINGNFKDVNALIDALDEALADVNLMLDNVRNLQAKLESNGILPQRVYAYLDKVATKVAQYTPELFKPALFINSDNGFGVCGFQGAPSVVKGNVTIVPTTWNGELLTPVFKKYIRVNGGNGQFVESNTLDITSQLKSGVNVVEYRALDYHGVEWVGYYQIIR